ncbi:MAG: tetratricopeptide repeat protein [Bacteroidota bacterium]
MKYYLQLLLVLFSHFSLAQHTEKIDSLQAVLPQLEGESRVNALRDLCFYMSRTDSEVSIAYGNEAVALAQELGNQALLGLAYKDLAHAFDGADLFETAIATYGKATAIFKIINDQEQIAYVYNNVGSIYLKKGDFDTSLNYLFRSLALKDSLGGIKLNTTYGNIGDTFRKKGDHEKALEYLFRSLKIAEQTNDQKGIAATYGNIGITYEAQGNYELALEYGLKAMQINQELGNRYNYAINLNNIGLIYYRRGEYTPALEYCHQALALKKQLNQRGSMAYTSQRLAEIYADLEQYDSALFYANSSLALFDTIDSKERKVETYRILSEIYRVQGEYEKAFTSHQDYTLLKDSILNAEKERLTADMEGKYQSAKKDLELLARDTTIAEQKANQRVYIGLAVGLLLLSAGLLFFYRKRQQRNRELQHLNNQLDAKNQQNELLLKEIHHRVKNNLEMVKSLIALQSAQLEDSATKDAMIASQNRVQSMGIIHQKLYQGENLGSVEMKDYFLNLGEGILDSFDAEDQVKIECAMDRLELDVDTAVPIGLIVNELLTNALKYAFPEETPGTINISLSRTDDNTLTLTVVDNGVGKMAETAPRGTGFGSQLVQLLTQQLNGQMQEESQDGTRVFFRFQLDQVA